jgi:hypothetical protein
LLADLFPALWFVPPPIFAQAARELSCKDCYLEPKLNVLADSI